MTSLELVDFINSFGVQEGRERALRHDHFMVKVPKVLGEKHAPKFLGTQSYGNSNSRPVYNFPKREACLMAMSYSYELQAKVKAEAPAVLETPEQTIARALLLAHASLTQAAERVAVLEPQAAKPANAPRSPGTLGTYLRHPKRPGVSLVSLRPL